MNKQEFLKQLRQGLVGLPQSDIEERINFYSEMIDDRIDEGFSEEDAVRDMGAVEEIVSQIVSQTPLRKIIKNKMKPKRKLSAWEIVLLTLGSPIWLSILIALFAVVFSVCVVLWSVIVTLWSVFGALAGSAVGGIGGGIIVAISTNAWAGGLLIGSGFFCGGCAIFAFFGCKAATKGLVFVTKKIALGIKYCFVRKKEAA